mgnify:CR=1 FL=1
MLSPEVVVDADKSALHLGDNCLGRVHVGAGLRVGVFFLAVEHILVVSHRLSQAPITLTGVVQRRRNMENSMK